MKNIILFLSLSILTSCWDNSTTEDVNSKPDSSSSIVTQDSLALSDSIISFISKSDRFNSLREKVQGKLLYDTIWQKDRTNIYMTLLSMEYSHDKEFGGIYINQWRWGKSSPEFEWMYSDTLSCDWQDVIIHYDLDSLIISDIDNDNKNEIIIIYTLSCTTDVSPNTRYLIALDTEGKIKVKLKGWTKDPASVTDISKINLKYNQKTDDYNPDSPEGKIENYSALEKIDRQTSDLLLRLWKSALERDK
jgi:hypothetical protein